MEIWQIDCYRRPLKNESGQPLWELLVCDASDSAPLFSNLCPQSEVNADWVRAQFPQVNHGKLPDKIQVFRPQSLSLIETVAESFGIPVEPTRRTLALKRSLIDRAKEYPSDPRYIPENYEPLAIDKPPPLPLPENLWGEQWRMATVKAGDLIDTFADLPIPVKEIPEFVTPIQLGLASTVAVPGIVIYGGRSSMQLARWLQEINPVSINYIPGQPDGLILEAGLCDRWVIATFEDKEVAAAAQNYQTRKQLIKGLHFLLVQPDDSGMTYSGFWLLQD